MSEDLDEEIKFNKYMTVFSVLSCTFTFGLALGLNSLPLGGLVVLLYVLFTFFSNRVDSLENKKEIQELKGDLSG